MIVDHARSGARASNLRCPALLTGLLVVGCADLSEDVPHGLQRMKLAAASGRNVAPVVPEIVRRLTVPEEVSPWVAEPLEHEIVSEPVGAEGALVTGLHVSQSGLEKITVPGPFAVGSFDRVTLAVRCEKPVVVDGRLLRKGRAAASALRKPYSAPSDDVELVHLEFVHEETSAEPYDALQITLRSVRPLTLYGIDLMRVPPEARLPQLADGPRLYSIGPDARRCIGLSSGEPLSGEVVIPRDGVLDVSYGWPEVVSTPGRAVELLVRAEGGGATAVGRFPLSSGQWRRARLDLSELAGALATVVFSLEADAGAEVFCTLGVPAVYANELDPSTVLLVTSDTHRFDHLGASGQGVAVDTPLLDELAATGVFFESCFSPSNTTLPSHVALMTGTSPRDTRILTNHTPISGQAVTLAEAFHDAGYRTLAAVSVRHLRHAASGLGQGFDRMSWPDGAAARDADETIAVLEDWLSDTGGQPLFVWLHLFDAHTPYEVPEQIARLYYPDDRDPFDAALPEPDAPMPYGFDGVRDVEYPRAIYRAEIHYLDDQLRRIFAFERLAKGIVAFTADHGESLGQHDVWWDHSGLFPDSLHVPLVLRWPDGPAGVRVRRGARQTDLARTLLDLAGLDRVSFAGSSLMDDDLPEEPRFAISSIGQQASVTLGPHHLILSLRRHPLGNVRKDRAKGMRRIMEKHQVQLYDLERDPRCTSDLVEAERETATKLRALLVDWLVAAPGNDWALESDLDQATIDQLAALGYAADLDRASGGSEAFFDAGCDCTWCSRFQGP